MSFWACRASTLRPSRTALFLPIRYVIHRCELAEQLEQAMHLRLKDLCMETGLGLHCFIRTGESFYYIHWRSLNEALSGIQADENWKQ